MLGGSAAMAVGFSRGLCSTHGSQDRTVTLLLKRCTHVATKCLACQPRLYQWLAVTQQVLCCQGGWVVLCWCGHQQCCRLLAGPGGGWAARWPGPGPPHDGIMPGTGCTCLYNEGQVMLGVFHPWPCGQGLPWVYPVAAMSQISWGVGLVQMVTGA